MLVEGDGNSFIHNQGATNQGDGIRGTGSVLESDRRNYATGNGGVNCQIDGFTAIGGGHYC